MTKETNLAFWPPWTLTKLLQGAVNGALEREPVHCTRSAFIADNILGHFLLEKFFCLFCSEISSFLNVKNIYPGQILFDNIKQIVPWKPFFSEDFISAVENDLLILLPKFISLTSEDLFSLEHFFRLYQRTFIFAL